MLDLRKNRFTKYLLGRKKSDMPFMPIVTGDHASFISGVKRKDMIASGKVMSDSLITAQEEYGLDAVFVFSDVYVEAEAMGVKLHYADDEFPKVIDLPNPSEIRPADPLQDGRLPEMIEAGSLCLQKFGNRSEVFVVLKDPFSLSVLLNDPEVFFKNCLKDPEANKNLLKISEDNQLLYLQEILQTGALPLIGAPYTSGSLISPALFREFVSPYLKSMIKLIKENGNPVIMHICGDTEVIINEIIQLEPDVLSIDELDIGRHSKLLSGKTMLMGNLSTTLLLKETEKQVRKATLKLFESMNSPCIPSTSCDVPRETPKNNIHAMLNVINNFRTSISRIDQG